jgi:hypothetical protein
VASVIDSLVVELGLDPSKFTAGQTKALDAYKKGRQAIEDENKKIEVSMADVSTFISKLRDQAIELFAIFTAGRGIKDFIQDTVTTTAAIGRLAYQFDESVSDLAAWRNAAQQTGGSADDITSSIGSLTNDLQQLTLTGQSATIPYFRALGIGITDAKGRMKSATQLFLEINRAVQGMDPARARSLIMGLGLGQSAVNLLTLNPSRLQAILETARKSAPTQADIKAAQAYQQAWFQIQQQSETVGRTMLTDVAPALLQVLGYLKQFFTYLQTHKDTATTIFYAMATAVGVLSTAIGIGLARTALGQLAWAFKPIIYIFDLFLGTLIPEALLSLATLTSTALPALSEAFFALGAAMEATPLGWLITGLAAIIGLGYLAYKTWNVAPSKKGRQQYNELTGQNDTWVYENGTWKNKGSGASGLSSNAWVAAKSAQQKYGIPAEVTYAQWQLESGSGKHTPPGSNNPFGIKASPGQPGVNAWTTEIVNGKAERVMARFAKFASLADAFEAHARLLATSSKYAAARKLEDNPYAFANALTGVYATDPTYGGKLGQIIAQISAQSGGGNSSSNATTNIGELHIHTKATDMAGIAKDARTQLARNTFAAQAQGGGN